MVIVTSGLDKNGKPCSFYMDGTLLRELTPIKKLVTKKNHYYCAIVAGPPGSGKSTFLKGPAKLSDPTFDESRYCFSADEFIKKSNDLPPHSAIVLDESFESLNTNVSRSKEFLRVLNHLQIIRQKNLFIFLCLPNFFDLAKNVAIFLTSHLFLTYVDIHGDRGRFLAFGRPEKRRLYVIGKKFVDYNCVKANFKARYPLADHILDTKAYERRKFLHLKRQEKLIEVFDPKGFRNEVIYRLRKEYHFKNSQLVNLFGLKRAMINLIIAKKSKEEANAKG